MENPIKMDDLGVPLFSETSKYVELLEVLATKIGKLFPKWWLDSL